MKIYIGTDHAGYVLKEKLVSFLKLQGHEVVDMGAFEYNEEDVINLKLIMEKIYNSLISKAFEN